MTEYTALQLELARELELKSLANIERFKQQRLADERSAATTTTPREVGDAEGSQR